MRPLWILFAAGCAFDPSEPAGDSSSTPTCAGAGAYKVCDLTTTSEITLPATLNTDTAAGCALNSTWGEGQPAACLVVGLSITGKGTVVTGSRPLVLVARTTIELGGTLRVAAAGSQPGPGGRDKCGEFLPLNRVGMDNSSGGGGGAGGSHLSQGGDGANGGQGSNGTGGMAPATENAPQFLRGGCPGQVGGSGDGPAGAPGAGGGAVALLAGTSIELLAGAVVNASGGGARASAWHKTGGSGGGSGGMIMLMAPSIQAQGAVLMAMGGGGASGTTQDQLGSVGGDPVVPVDGSAPVGGAGGGAAALYRGGTGASPGVAPEIVNAPNHNQNNTGGGGGGGGVGYIAIRQLDVTAAPAARFQP